MALLMGYIKVSKMTRQSQTRSQVILVQFKWHPTGRESLPIVHFSLQYFDLFSVRLMTSWYFIFHLPPFRRTVLWPLDNADGLERNMDFAGHSGLEAWFYPLVDTIRSCVHCSSLSLYLSLWQFVCAKPWLSNIIPRPYKHWYYTDLSSCPPWPYWPVSPVHIRSTSVRSRYTSPSRWVVRWRGLVRRPTTQSSTARSCRGIMPWSGMKGARCVSSSQ